MPAEHARPLVAYLCVAVAAALVLVQGMGAPSRTVSSGVLGDAVRTVQVAGMLADRVVLTPFRADGEVAIVGRPARRPVAGAGTAAVAPRRTPASAPMLRETIGRPGSTAAGQKPAAPQRTSLRATRPGKDKGKAHGAARTKPREATSAQRPATRSATVRGHGHGRGHGGPRR